MKSPLSYHPREKCRSTIFDGMMLIIILCFSCNTPTTDADWSHYLGGHDRNHFSSLDQITAENVNQLEIVWEFRSGDPGQMQCNPLIIDGYFFATTAVNDVVCLDAGNGQLL